MLGQSAHDPFHIDNIEPHDVRYFAMLNNAVAICGDNQLEGGTPRDALAYYNYLLNIQIPNCPSSFNLVGQKSVHLKQPQLKALTVRMDNLAKMNALMEGLFATNSLYTKEGLDKVISAIDKNCAENNVSYLPSGYRNKDEGGHFAGLKARKLENGHYAFSCLNHGDGMQYHQKTSISGDKVKSSYQSDEYEIDLQSEEGREFLQRILELCFDAQQKSDSKRITNVYSADDLYGLLKLYGKQLPSPPPEKMHEKSVTPQRTGTCPITNTHAMARDSLIDNDAGFNQRKRYHFVIKLRSLIAAFNEYRNGNSKYTIPIMEWALNEFSVRLNKQYSNILSDEEMIYCAQLQAQITERLNRDKEAMVKAKCEPKPYPELTGTAPKHNQSIYDVSKITTDGKKELPTEQIKLENKISKSEIKPEYIKDLLKIDEKAEKFPFKKMYDLFNLLPHCSGLNEDKFWDKVPQEDLTIIIANLYKIIQQLEVKSFDSPQQRARSLALALLAYDIAAQLAPRCKEFKLDDKFTLGLDDVYSEQYFFTDPIAYHTVKRVAKNFEQRAENKERIFSNAVNYDSNNYDHTVYYVINVLLNYDQRQAVIKECSDGKSKPSDEEIFEYLMEHLEMKDDKKNPVLDKAVVELIAIAGTVHALGNFTKKYVKKNDLWIFAENLFHSEAQRKSQLQNLEAEGKKSWRVDEIAKHLPTVEYSADEYKDYAENTIYHPYSNLLKIRENNYSMNIPPYQAKLSGSIRSNSTVWKPENNQQFLYEKLNEDLRLIECAPNFQIVKACDWALSNLDMLRNKDVRVRINELLFQYGKLDTAYANELESTLLNMQYFLGGLLKYCQEEALDDTKLLVWAADLANNLRYHLEVDARLYNLPINQFALPGFKELLLHRIQNERDADVRSRLASQFICSYRNNSPFNINDCCLLLTCRVAANLGNEASVSDEVWQNLSAEVIAKITSKNNEVTKKLNDLLSSYNLTTVKEWKLEGLQLQAIGTNFYIDLTTGSLRERGEPKFKKERTEKTIVDNKELFASLHLPPKDNKFQLLYSDVSSWSETKILKSSDGQWEFTYYVGGGTDTKFIIDRTYQVLNIEGLKTKFKLLKKDEVSKFFDKKNPFESDGYAGSHYQYWQSLEDNDLIFGCHKNDDVAYSYSKDYDLILIAPDSEKDFDLEKLRNLSKANNNNPILIKCEGKISLYGFFENSWKLTELDSSNKEFIKAVNELTFPPKKTISLEYLNKLEKLKQKELKEKGSCDDYIEDMLENEKNAIEKKRNKIDVIIIKSTKDAIINQEISKSHTPTKNNVITQLTLNKDVPDRWQRSGKELLNLVKPQTAIEQAWAKRLGPMFGTSNVRCTASLSADKLTWSIESIEHLALGLSFKVNEKQQLMCLEEPGYYLANQSSLEALNGMPNIIILQNDKNEKKYLVPAYSLKKGENNNAFMHEDIIDFETLCNVSQPYYSYTLNNQNELVTESTEGNLYLAIIYRSLGDFERAIKYLESCKKHENIDTKIGAIAFQILTRKINSPISAAFNLKLACYLKEHQAKWSKDEKIISPTYPDKWDKFINGQLDFYKKTFSSYKKGIAIIPSYARLTKQELALLPKSNADLGSPPQPSDRLEHASKLEQLFLTQEGYCGRFVDYNLKCSNTDDVPDKLATFRQYGKQDSAFYYLLKNFRNLFMDAISNDANRRNSLNRTLFALLQNDENPKGEFYSLFTFLVMARECSQYFTNFTPPSDNLECITKVGEIFYQHGNELKDKRFYLFTYEANPYLLNAEASLASNFVPEAVEFAIVKIQHEQECKHPLASIVERYFTKSNEAVAQEDFRLEPAGLPDATLLEKKLFDRFKEGHEKNKHKMKAVYNVMSNAMLPDLKDDLEQLKKADKRKLKELHNSLLKKANLLSALEDNTASLSEKAKAYNLLQARASGQKHEIHISDLFTAFLQKTPSILTEQNPFLKRDDVEQLFAELADYALLQSRIDQTKQALMVVADKKNFNDLQNYQKQLFAGILDKPRAYDIRKYPEFLIYEYATHRILRDDQVEVLINLIELIENQSGDIHQALLQFAAGGGKTSVLIPILAQRFASKGILPVIINTTELYKSGLDDIPKNLRDSFQQKIEVIDRELEHKWTEDELKKLLKDLEHWLTEGKCLLIKAVTWHSINIAMKSAYFDRKFEIAKAAQDVLDFFKNHSVKLEDECYLVSDPLQQSIKTDGKPQKIPSDQIDLLLRCYDYLIGREAKTSSIETLAGIKSNRKRSIRPDELDLLQKKLAKIIVNEDIFKTIPREDFLNYLLPKDKNDKTRPLWLENLHNSTDEKMQQMADLIVLARAFLYTHLPHILSLQYLKDYGTSIHQGDTTVAPKQEGNNVSSHFGDHTLVAALTIQLYEQRGLLPEQVDQLIDQLIKEHKQERLWNYDFSKPTQAEQWLMNIMPSLKSFKELTLETKSMLRQDELILKNTQMIRKYLYEFALPQIQVSPKRITSTAAEMQAGFPRSILFSATPSLPEIYPAFLERCFLEESFEAQVIDTLLQERNKKWHVLIKPTQTPADFFEQFSPELLARMTTLIDRGSLLTAFEAKDIIKSYLGLDKTRIPNPVAAFFSKSQDNSKQKMKLKSKSPGVKKADISGTALVEELKRQKVNPESFLLFLFLDLSKTTGTDIKRPYTDHAGLTVGKEQTVTETIQAAMRERQLLDEDAQSITWLMFQALYREINPCELISIPSILPVDIDFNTLPIKSNIAYACSENKIFYINKVNKECKEIPITGQQLKKFNEAMNPTKEGRILAEDELQEITEITSYALPEFFDARQIFYWMIKNEAKEIEAKLINRAYQGIEQALSELAWQEIHKNPQAISTYEKALEEKQELSPYLIYELAAKKNNTELVLRKRVDELIEKFNFKKETIPAEVMSRINKIIQETSQLIAELQDPPKSQLGIEVQQELQKEQKEELQLQQHTHVKNTNDNTSDFEFAVEIYTPQADNLTTIFNKSGSAQLYQLLRLPGCDDIKHPELLFCPHHFIVTQQQKSGSELAELKKITNLLVRIMPDNQMQFVACTAAGMEYYAEQIKKNKLTDKYPAYTIMSTNGAIFRTSNNVSITELEQLVESEDCQEMLTYTHFLNGEISNPIMLSQIVKQQGWNKNRYERLANGIANVHVSQQTVSLLNNEILETCCGWNNKKTSTTMTTSTRRGKATEEKISKEAQQILRPVDVLENYIETTFVPIVSPQHALGSDLLGMKPEPISKNADGKTFNKAFGLYSENGGSLTGLGLF